MWKVPYITIVTILKLYYKTIKNKNTSDFYWMCNKKDKKINKNVYKKKIVQFGTFQQIIKNIWKVYTYVVV